MSPSSFWRGRQLPLLLCGFVLLCGAPLSSWCQDFKDSETYQVSGAQLNRLQTDLQTAKSELKTLQTRNEQLEKDSASKQTALAELQAQLKTVLASFKTSQNEALGTEIKVGVATFLAGAAVAFALHH